MALFRRPTIPTYRLGSVLWHTIALLIHSSQHVLGIGVVLLIRPIVPPAYRLGSGVTFVVRHALVLLPNVQGQFESAACQSGSGNNCSLPIRLCQVFLLSIIRHGSIAP